MKRPAPWQARRIATAKALRALPDCTTLGCTGRAMGFLHLNGKELGLVCVRCAAKATNEARRAQREKRT